MPSPEEQARLRENAKFAEKARKLREQQTKNNAKIARVRAREARRNKRR